MIPLMLDLTERHVAIFGGGEVGARKAAYFMAEADVEVVSRSFSPAFGSLPVRRRSMDLSTASDEVLRQVLDGVALAVGATSDPALNNRIGKMCREMGIHFNNADGEEGDVLIPSVIRGEHYCIAVSTSGKSPAVPRYVRQVLEKEIPDLDRMIELQSELRSALKKRGVPRQRRAAILRAVLMDPEIRDLLAENRSKAYESAKKRYLDA